MNCRICDHSGLESGVDLGQQPWANHFLRPNEIGSERAYPLRVVWCPRCRAAQLDFTVSKETLFGNHTYRSGVTATLNKHFEDMARCVFMRFSPKTVLDIGSNDGTQLKYYKALGCEVLGIEACATIAAIAQEAGIPTWAGFWNETVADMPCRTFDIVNASGVLFHLEDLHSAMRGIRKCLADDGVLIISALYWPRILEIGAWDQIYHEHLLYYSLESLEALLAFHWLEIFDCYLSPIHGGSLIAFVSHRARKPTQKRYNDFLRQERQTDCNTLGALHRFEDRMRENILQERERLVAWHRAGKRVFGMGAPVKGNTRLNAIGANPDVIAYLMERNELRRGLIAPGSHIPIRLEDEIAEPPDVYYVLAWNFREEILARYRALVDAGVEFHFPVEA